MDFAFSEEQEMLRRSAREFLAKECPPKAVRRAMESADAYDPVLWKKMAALGWTALGIPEAYGGAGTFLDLAVVLEETGRALVPGPFFATMGLAVPAMLEAGSDAQKKQVLGAIAAGEARATLAFTESSGRWDASSITMRATQEAGAWRLDGVKQFVPDAHVADYIVVAARSRGEGEEGITLFLVPAGTPGVAVTPLQTMDMTRRWCEVRFDGASVGADLVMGEPHKAWPRLKRALEWGAAALCAEMAGGASKVLESSSEYAKSRQQFGKQIGVYQAVSHRIADMLVMAESGKSATYYAAWAIDADAPDRGVATSTAKAYVSDAYRQISNAGIQVHGGIGFTWEHDSHLFLKRAKSCEVMLGDATYHRELVAQSLDL